MARIFIDLPVASKKDVIKALETGNIGHLDSFSTHERKPIWGKSPIGVAMDEYRAAQMKLNLMYKNALDSIKRI